MAVFLATQETFFSHLTITAVFFLLPVFQEHSQMKQLSLAMPVLFLVQNARIKANIALIVQSVTTSMKSNPFFVFHSSIFFFLIVPAFPFALMDNSTLKILPLASPVLRIALNALTATLMGALLVSNLTLFIKGAALSHVQMGLSKRCLEEPASAKAVWIHVFRALAMCRIQRPKNAQSAKKSVIYTLKKKMAAWSTVEMASDIRKENTKDLQATWNATTTTQ